MASSLPVVLLASANTCDPAKRVVQSHRLETLLSRVAVDLDPEETLQWLLKVSGGGAKHLEGEKVQLRQRSC